MASLILAKPKILCVFGTRPEAIKMAPIVTRLERERQHLRLRVVVTAQHRHMLDQVLRFFHLPVHHDLNLMTENQSLEQVTFQGLRSLSQVLRRESPNLVLVQGDTTTCFATALAAFYQRIPVGHVEAGLRSYNKCHPYPEEANRVMTDALASLHFAPTAQARQHLLAEHVPASSIFVTGNTGIDALLATVPRIHQWRNPSLHRLFGHPGGIPEQARVILVTAHRRENFGPPLAAICRALRRVIAGHPDAHVVYPVHLNPNILRPVRQSLDGLPRIHLVPPVNYLDLVRVLQRAYVVLTDSGGLQEEAPALGKPVLVLRQITERPEGVWAGTAKLVGTEEDRIVREVRRLFTHRASYLAMSRAVNPYGDGRAAERIVQIVRYYFHLRRVRPRDWRSGGPLRDPRRLRELDRHLSA